MMSYHINYREGALLLVQICFNYLSSYRIKYVKKKVKLSL
jgi:hypothetical protein